MRRREFLKSSIILFTPLITITKETRAAIDPVTLSAICQMSTAVISYLGRGSDPSLEVMISMSKMLEAIGKKIDAIDQKLDVLVDEIADIKSSLLNVPKDTIQLSLLNELREPWRSFLEV